MKGSALRRRLLVGLLVAVGGFVVVVPPVFSGESQPAALGMTIYIDPQTGAILKEPAPGSVPLQLTPQLRNALSTSHQGLVETPSAVVGGGIKLDLQGRGVCREIALPLLSRADLDRYLELTFAAHEFPPEFAAVVHARTDGLPLFMVDALVEFDMAAAEGRHAVVTATVKDLAGKAPMSVRA